MAEKKITPSSRINPTKGTPTSSFAQDTNNIKPVEHRVDPVENGADLEEAKKVERESDRHKEKK